MRLGRGWDTGLLHALYGPRPSACPTPARTCRVTPVNVPKGRPKASDLALAEGRPRPSIVAVAAAVVAGCLVVAAVAVAALDFVVAVAAVAGGAAAGGAAAGAAAAAAAAAAAHTFAPVLEPQLELEHGPGPVEAQRAAREDVATG
eukprot:COSAG04_NODE_7208_length_1167_cov_1.275281_1_plen_145_part_10